MGRPRMLNRNMGLLAAVRTQLTWFRKEGVPRMLVTHCGSQIVEGEGEGIRDRIIAYAEERGGEVEVAHDGMEVVLR